MTVFFARHDKQDRKNKRNNDQGDEDAAISKPARSQPASSSRPPLDNSIFTEDRTDVFPRIAVRIVQKLRKGRDLIRQAVRNATEQDKYSRPRARSADIASRIAKNARRGNYAGGPTRLRTMFPVLMRANLNPDIAPINEGDIGPSPLVER